MRLVDLQAMAAGIEELARWLRRQVPSELSFSSLSALTRLKEMGPLRVSELATLEAMTQPGSTILVNRLADGGYAERVPDPTDRRAALVRITEAGEALLAGRARQRARILAERIESLSDEDQQLLVSALPALRRLLATTDTQGRS